jgi:3-dehydroquinate dehydratase/shikimate dehydrogenase
MICVSVTPESRRLAKADLVNASRRGDLIELCLDRLLKSPDVGEMLEGIDHPIIVSCRRKQDGGNWAGTEDERRALLRQAILAGPAWIELDHETAKFVPRFGKTKRIVSFTKLDAPFGNVDALFDQGVAAGADVVKFTCATPTLEGAWSLLSAVSRKRSLPTVGLGIGRSSTLLAILGQRFGAPWTYAALEPGMELFEGQVTRDELEEVYDVPDIGPETRFFGVVGLGAEERVAIAALNRGLAAVGKSTRCLPLHPTRFDKFPSILEQLRIRAVIANPEAGPALHALAGEYDDVAFASGCADVLIRRENGWQGGNLVGRAVSKTVERRLAEATPDTPTLERRQVLLVGSGGLAMAVGAALVRSRPNLSITAPDDAGARALADRFQARHVPYATVYNTLCDVLVLAEPNLVVGTRRNELNPSILREGMTVADVSRIPQETGFAREAQMRGCRVVDPQAVYRALLERQFQSLSGGKPFPADLELLPAATRT